jgi:hypothetical protein
MARLAQLPISRGLSDERAGARPRERLIKAAAEGSRNEARSTLKLKGRNNVSF